MKFGMKLLNSKCSNGLCTSITELIHANKLLQQEQYLKQVNYNQQLQQQTYLNINQDIINEYGNEKDNLDNERQKLLVEKKSFENQKEYFLNEAKRKANEDIKSLHKEEIVQLEAKLHAAEEKLTIQAQESENTKKDFAYDKLEDVKSLYEKGDPFLLSIGAEWCGYSTELQKKYPQIQETLQNEHNISSVYLNADDDVANKFVSSIYKLEGYPTLLVIKDKNASEYSGARNVEGISTFIHQELNKNDHAEEENADKEVKNDDQDQDKDPDHHDKNLALEVDKLGLEQQLASKEPILLTVYADWCGHSKMFMPVLDNLANISDNKFRTVKIDLSKHRDASDLIKHKVVGFPTVLAINNDKVHEYNGQRHEDHIKEWMLAQCGGDSKQKEDVGSQAQEDIGSQGQEDDNSEDQDDSDNIFEIQDEKKIDDLKNDSKPTLLLMYTNWCGHSRVFLPEFDKLKELNKENKLNVHKIDMEKYPKTAETLKFNLIGYPTIVLVHNGSTVGYEGKREANELYNWAINQNNQDLENLSEDKDAELNIKSNQELEDLLNSEDDLLLLVGHNDCVHTKNMMTDYKNVQKQLNNNHINVKYIDYKSYSDIKQLEEKVKIEGFPTLFLHKGSDKTYNEFNDHRTAEQILKWCGARSKDVEDVEDVEDVKENEKPTFDSLKITDDQLLEKVKQDKPFLLLTYADFCSHSRNVKPEYEKLKNNTNYDVVAYDYESNPEVFNKLNKFNLDIIGLPTVSLFSNNTFINYNNKRLANDIDKWTNQIININIADFILKNQEQLNKSYNDKATKLYYLNRKNPNIINKKLSTNLVNLKLNGIDLYLINNPELFVSLRKKIDTPFSWDSFIFIKNDTVNILNDNDFNEFIINSL